MKRNFFTLLLLLLCATASAQVAKRYAIDSMQYEIRDFRDSMRFEIRFYKDSIRDVRRHQYDSLPHELRLGCGDQLFESLIWQEMGAPETYPDGFRPMYKTNYRYTQHWFVEYLYHVNYWYSFGFIVDYSGVLWDEVSASQKQTGAFHNIALMPEVRFSYFHSDYVSLYSSLGIGLNINTGTELDYKGRKTACAPVVNLSLLGLRVGKGRVYGGLEVGGMMSFISTNEMYMLGSRLVTASVGVRL